MAPSLSDGYSLAASCNGAAAGWVEEPQLGHWGLGGGWGRGEEGREPGGGQGLATPRPYPPTQILVTSVGAEQLSCGRSDPRL